jgi:Nif-specific regulatory protein
MSASPTDFSSDGFLASTATGITSRALSRLVVYHWPGNVRELENELRRAMVLARGAQIDERHLSMHVRRTPVQQASSGTSFERRSAFESQLIRETLRETGGNQSRAAEQLGISRQYLVRRLRMLRATESVGSHLTSSPRGER